MSEAKSPVELGEILAGKYRVERVLGKGGMGIVVAAMHLQLEQLVALKFLLSDAAKNPDVVGRFAREARAAVKLQSEHVARVSDVGTLENGSPYMVMEYLEGQDLAHAIDKEGALDPHEAVDFVLQACEAIAEAHALGIVHRDLKPSNLFLAKRSDRTKSVKVLDFGISKLLSGPEESAAQPSLTRTTDVLGSPMYMSPEQLRSSRTVDARSDIWSLGVILFEILTLESPFKVGTLAEICGAILHEEPKLLGDVRPDMPQELEEVILRCLEKKADNRFQSVFELAEALEPFGGETAPLSMTQISRYAPPSYDGQDEALASTMVAKHLPDIVREDAAPARVTTGSRTARQGGRGGAERTSGARATGRTTGTRTSSARNARSSGNDGALTRDARSRTQGPASRGARSGSRASIEDAETEVAPTSGRAEGESKATSVAWDDQPRSTASRPQRSAWPFALALCVVLGVGVGAAWKLGYVQHYFPQQYAAISALTSPPKKAAPAATAAPAPPPATATAATTVTAATPATTKIVATSAPAPTVAATVAPSASASASAAASSSASSSAPARPSASAAAAKPGAHGKHVEIDDSQPLPEPTVAPARQWNPGEDMPTPVPQPKQSDPYE